MLGPANQDSQFLPSWSQKYNFEVLYSKCQIGFLCFIYIIHLNYIWGIKSKDPRKKYKSARRRENNSLGPLLGVQ